MSRGSVATFAAVTALALALRLVYFAELRESPFFRHALIDAQTHHEQALALAEGREAWDDVYWQPPLYPYVLGFFYRLAGPEIPLARLVQLLLGALTCGLTALLGRRLFGPWAGAAAGVLTATSGTLVFFDGELLNPVLSLFLNVVALLLLVTPPAAGGWRGVARLPLGRWLAAGVVLGLSIAARPDVGLFAVAVAAAPLAAGLVWGRRLARAGLFVLAVLVPILPFTAHNVITGGEWVLVSSNSGVNFYLGNSSDYDATVGIRPGFDWTRLMDERRQAGITVDDARGRSRFWATRALAAIQADPLGWLGSLGKKAVLAVGAAEVNRLLDLRFCARFTPVLAVLPGWGLVFPLAVVGLVLAVAERRAALLALYLAGYVAVLLAFFVAARYRLPMVPVLAVLAGLAVERARRWLVDGERRKVLAVVAAVVGTAALIRVDVHDAGRVDFAEAFYYLGFVLEEDGQLDDAAAAYQRAVELGDPHWDAAYALAGVRLSQGQAEDALSLYREVLAANPDNHLSLVNLARLLDSLGRRREALELLEGAVTSPSSPPPLLAKVAPVLLDLGLVEESWTAVRRATATGYAPDQGDLLPRLTVQRAVRARLDARLAQASPAPEEADADVRARLEEAHQALNEGHRNEAERVLAGVVLSRPGCAAAWEDVGKLWSLNGRLGPAVAAFRRALELDPVNADAHLGLARALASDPATVPEAAVVLRQLLERVPEGPQADVARRALEQLRQREAEP